MLNHKRKPKIIEYLNNLDNNFLAAEIFEVWYIECHKYTLITLMPFVFM
jgi:hypothetical protein